MPGDAISVDDLLAQQAEAGGLLATLEAVAERPDDVRVTPYRTNAGCQCAFAVVVPKQAIEQLVTTDETHWCCGKRLAVVQVTFADPTLADVIEQLTGPGRGPAAYAEPAFRGMPLSPVSDRVYLDTRTAATGVAIDYATGAPLPQTRFAGATHQPTCLEQRTNCWLRCGVDDWRCQCHCENAYHLCRYPLSPLPFHC